MEVLELLDVVLEDDGSPYGGVSFDGETLRDFINELGLPYNIDFDELNKRLKECGIKELEVKEID